MPKISTFPTLFDEVKSFSISDLKRWQYLEPEYMKSGKVTWSRQGNRIGSIRITVDMDQQTVQLSYNYGAEPVSYKVSLVSVQSNLGFGRVWYFHCPVTGKRARKLYGAGKYFLHREAYPHAMYEKQTYSHYGRSLDRAFKDCFRHEKLIEELYSKHFKRYYAGKPTKRYQRIMRSLKKSEGMESQALELMNRFLI